MGANGSSRPNMTQRAILKDTKLDMSLKFYSDYMDTLSPFSKKNSLSIMILELHYIDVKTTFLKEDLNEEVYMNHS